MTIQVTDKKKLAFRVNENEYFFCKPNYLFKDFGEMIKATAKGSTMGWYIEGEFLSYNQMRKYFEKQVAYNRRNKAISLWEVKPSS